MNWQAVEKWAIEELTRLLPIGGRAALGKMITISKVHRVARMMIAIAPQE